MTNMLINELSLCFQGENETNRETEAETEADISLSLEEKSRETDSSSDTLPPSSKYPSLPSWEVQVTNDSGEFETMLVPRSKHVPYVPWTGGLVIFLGCACLYFAFYFLC